MNKIDYIDPIIGTVGDEQQTSMHGGGKTHPGACYPFGMVQLSPDTTTSGDNGTGYNYCQNTVEGFSFNHMSGIGWYGDLGNLQVMPIVGETDLRSGSNAEIPFKKGTQGWKSPFSHEKEHAAVGYYSVELQRYKIFCEATVSAHTGLLRVSYPKSDNSGLIINFSRRIAGHADFEHVEIIDKNKIEGYVVCTPAGGGFGRGGGNISYKLYFVMELSKPFKSAVFFSDEEYLDKNIKSLEGEDVGLLLRFDTAEDEKITLKCALSYTDLDGARNNFEAENYGFDFDKTLQKTRSAWEDAFECVSAEGENEKNLTLFYTCLYHTMLDPRICTDADGRYSDASGKIKRPSYTQRTMFSGWDVYRSEFPLLTLINPEVVNDEVNSLLSIALSKNSAFPRWELMGIDSHCMVGDPGTLVMADAYLKGIRNFDIEKAYEIALASSKSVKTLGGREFDSIRPRSKAYLENAFVPHDLSSTLEFLLSDFVMANLAHSLGKNSDYEYFSERVKTYKSNFNKETGFMGARDENGVFVSVENEYSAYGCVESNVFQQSWFVPYDIEGLSELFGRERMISLLERLFEKAELSALWNENYNHSNEPCHNITHYFNALGEPQRTQYWTRRVQNEAYRLGAFGFCGNEDVGQLSAWYVLSACGFAQPCIGDKRYFINTPLFKNVKIRLSKKYHSCSVSDTFEITCDKEPDEFLYIEKITLNGKVLNRTYLTYEEITCGGVLEFELKK